MESIEVRIIDELQSYLDNVKEAQEAGDTVSRAYWAKKYVGCASFAERVTGKTIESGGWNVRFKEV